MFSESIVSTTLMNPCKEYIDTTTSKNLLNLFKNK